VSDEPRPMTHEEREAAIVEAKRDGGMCAACGRGLTASEPVYRRRLAAREGWSAYLQPVYCWAFVGRECATPEVREASEDEEPVAYAGCGRDIYHAGAPASRRVVACSQRCRVTIVRRRAKGGQPA